jgi:DNA-binding LacI/PurR family transcriptional regulator
LHGLEEGLAEHDLSLPRHNVRFSASYRAQFGASYAEHWLGLARSRAPTAVVLANDPLALGFLRTVQAAGVRVPAEVSVVGFDDIPSASLVYPALTTARQHLQEIGAAASASLLSQLEATGAPAKQLSFPVELVKRESTGAPPSA